MEPFGRSFGPNSGPSRRVPMTKPKNRIPPGSFYLIVEKSARFGDRFDLNE
jgi:hypothetical protein